MSGSDLCIILTVPLIYSLVKNVNKKTVRLYTELHILTTYFAWHLSFSVNSLGKLSILPVLKYLKHMDFYRPAFHRERKRLDWPMRRLDTQINRYRRLNSWTSILQKKASLLLNAIHSPLYWRIWKKTILYSGFNNPYKTSLETRKTRVSSWIAFCTTEKCG